MLRGAAAHAPQGYHTEVETGESLKASGLSRGDVWITTKGRFFAGSVCPT
jgi:hypothetical protein